MCHWWFCFCEDIVLDHQLKEFLQNPQEIIGSEGFVVYGGIIGGILVGWLYCTIKKLKFLTYFDLMMPSIALAQGFGRIGCLLAGCCYGKETTGSLAITFTDSAFAPNHVPLIPTQIYSSILDFAHFFLLLYVAKHKKADGSGGRMLSDLLQYREICDRDVQRGY